MPTHKDEGRIFYSGCRQVWSSSGRAGETHVYTNGDVIFCHVDGDPRPWVAQCLEFSFDPTIYEQIEAEGGEEPGTLVDPRELPKWMPMRVSLRWLYRISDVMDDTTRDDKELAADSHPCEVFFSDHVTRPEVNSVNIIDGRAILKSDPTEVPKVQPEGKVCMERTYLCRRFYRHSGALKVPNSLKSSKYFTKNVQVWRAVGNEELEEIISKPTEWPLLYFGREEDFRIDNELPRQAPGRAKKKARVSAGAVGLGPKPSATTRKRDVPPSRKLRSSVGNEGAEREVRRTGDVAYESDDKAEDGAGADETETVGRVGQRRSSRGKQAITDGVDRLPTRRVSRPTRKRRLALSSSSSASVSSSSSRESSLPPPQQEDQGGGLGVPETRAPHTAEVLGEQDANTPGPEKRYNGDVRGSKKKRGSAGLGEGTPARSNLDEANHLPEKLAQAGPTIPIGPGVQCEGPRPSMGRYATRQNGPAGRLASRSVENRKVPSSGGDHVEDEEREGDAYGMADGGNAGSAPKRSHRLSEKRDVAALGRETRSRRQGSIEHDPAKVKTNSTSDEDDGIDQDQWEFDDSVRKPAEGELSTARRLQSSLQNRPDVKQNNWGEKRESLEDAEQPLAAQRLSPAIEIINESFKSLTKAQRKACRVSLPWVLEALHIRLTESRDDDPDAFTDDKIAATVQEVLSRIRKLPPSQIGKY